MIGSKDLGGLGLGDFGCEMELFGIVPWTGGGYNFPLEQAVRRGGLVYRIDIRALES